jgi:hypothetical protein
MKTRQNTQKTKKRHEIHKKTHTHQKNTLKRNENATKYTEIKKRNAQGYTGYVTSQMKKHLRYTVHLLLCSGVFLSRFVVFFHVLKNNTHKTEYLK